MSADLICPDCGGVIGATDVTEAGQPCRCLPSEPADVKSSTMVIASPVGEKVCCVCGVDVTGKKRAKDERGYWCYDCHTKDKERRREERNAKRAAAGGAPKPNYEAMKVGSKAEVRPGQIREAKKNGTPQSNCPECGRLVPQPSMEMWDNILICARCYRDHRDAQGRQAKKKTHQAIERKTEWQRLLVLLVVLIILVVVALLGRYHILPSPV